MERGHAQLDSAYSRFKKIVKKQQIIVCATYLFVSVLAGYAFAEERNDGNSSAKDLNPANLNQLLEPRSAEQAVLLLADALEQEDPARNYALLEAAREHFLQRGNAAETATGLANFLLQGEDRRTGLTFRVGRGGRIDAPPSIRIAVLDWLADIDLERAIIHSRQILEQAQDAEEAAVALRNLGRHPEIKPSDEFLDQTLAFISNRQWLEEPSAGFFEGFDALVFIRPYDRLDMLLTIPEINQHLSNFVGLVMDSIIQNDRELVLPLLMELPIFRHSFDNIRPVWFARADVRDDNQRQVILEYLDHPSVGLGEREKFLSIFPLYTRMTAPRLLSRDRLLSMQEMVSVDRASLAFLSNLVVEAANPEVHISTILAKKRLQNFVSKAEQNERFESSLLDWMIEDE